MKSWRIYAKMIFLNNRSIIIWMADLGATVPRLKKLQFTVQKYLDWLTTDKIKVTVNQACYPETVVYLLHPSSIYWAHQKPLKCVLF